MRDFGFFPAGGDTNYVHRHPSLDSDINGDGVQDLAVQAEQTPQVRWIRFYDLTAGSANVQEQLEPQRTTALTVSPNPGARTVSLTYRLATPGPVDLGLYDVQGRQLRSLVQGNAGSGSYALPLDTTDLAPGVYFVRMKYGGEANTSTVQILR